LGGVFASWGMTSRRNTVGRRVSHNSYCLIYTFSVFLRANVRR
jgi:hypothetical protein